jgi:hypothetical protein
MQKIRERDKIWTKKAKEEKKEITRQKEQHGENLYP